MALKIKSKTTGIEKPNDSTIKLLTTLAKRKGISTLIRFFIMRDLHC